MTMEAQLKAAREAPIEAKDSDVRPTRPRPRQSAPPLQMSA